MKRQSQKAQGWIWVSASLGLHAVAVAILGLAVRPSPQFKHANSPTVYLEIEPRPVIDGVRTRAPVPSTTVGPAPALKDIRYHRPAKTNDSAQPPSTVTSPVAPDATGVRSTVQPSAPSPADPARDAIARSLRTSVLGCQYPERLSAEERRTCLQRESDQFDRSRERIDRIAGTGDRRRDEALQAQGRERLQAYERQRRAPPDSARGNVGVEDGPGSNFGMGVAGRHLDPSMRPDSGELVRTRRRDGDPDDRIQRLPPH